MAEAETASVRLRLPARLNTGTARHLYGLLREHEDDDLILDAADVEQIGGLCLQVLMAASIGWQARGLALAVRNLADGPRSDVARFGLDPAAAPFNEEIAP